MPINQVALNAFFDALAADVAENPAFWADCIAEQKAEDEARHRSALLGVPNDDTFDPRPRV